MNIYVKSKNNVVATVIGGVSKKTGKPAIIPTAKVVVGEGTGETLVYNHVAELIKEKSSKGIEELSIYIPSNYAIRARYIWSLSKNGALSGKELKKAITATWNNTEGLTPERVSAWENLSEAFEVASNNDTRIVSISGRREANWIRLTPEKGTNGEEVLANAVANGETVTLTQYVIEGDSREYAGIVEDGEVIVKSENNQFGVGREMEVFATKERNSTVYSLKRYEDPHADKAYSELTAEELKQYKGANAMATLAYKVLDEALPSGAEATTLEQDEEAIA